MTISSGYDSNLLVSLISNKLREETKYYCVGGSKGVDETITARKILEEYNNNNLVVSYVNDNTFSSFPEIVYLYEGLFYERGIFLQYELYKMLENKKQNIILGEGADQIMHQYYKQLHNIKDEIKKKKYSLYENCPYEMLIYLVLKKSSIILGKTKNNLIYPYLSKQFINYIDNFRDKFGLDKKLHKQIVNKTVLANINPYLKKIGGATEQIALFKDDDDFIKWKKLY